MGQETLAVGSTTHWVSSCAPTTEVSQASGIVCEQAPANIGTLNWLAVNITVQLPQV